MRNIYNKGKYRNGEYAKHLSPFLKTNGNRKWRRTSKAVIQNELELDNDLPTLSIRRIGGKQKKTIKIKIKEYWHKDFKKTSIKKYRTIRGVMNSLKRNKIIDGVIMKSKS